MPRKIPEGFSKFEGQSEIEAKGPEVFCNDEPLDVVVNARGRKTGNLMLCFAAECFRLDWHGWHELRLHLLNRLEEDPWPWREAVVGRLGMLTHPFALTAAVVHGGQELEGEDAVRVSFMELEDDDHVPVMVVELTREATLELVDLCDRAVAWAYPPAAKCEILRVAPN